MCSCLQNILNWIVYASYTDFKTKQYLENVAFCFDIHSILNSLMQKVNQVFNIYIDKSVRKWLRWKQTLPLIDNHSDCISQILILFIPYYFAFVVKRVTWEYTNKLLSDKIDHKPQTQSAAEWKKWENIYIIIIKKNTMQPLMTTWQVKDMLEVDSWIYRSWFFALQYSFFIKIL